MRRADGRERFPLNFTYHLARYFDDANDGLVGEKSFPWGESFEMLTVNGTRGISHGDMIDLNRENIGRGLPPESLGWDRQALTVQRCRLLPLPAAPPAGSW